MRVGKAGGKQPANHYGHPFSGKKGGGRRGITTPLRQGSVPLGEMESNLKAYVLPVRWDGRTASTIINRPGVESVVVVYWMCPPNEKLGVATVQMKYYLHGEGISDRGEYGNQYCCSLFTGRPLSSQLYSSNYVQQTATTAVQRSNSDTTAVQNKFSSQHTHLQPPPLLFFQLETRPAEAVPQLDESRSLPRREYLPDCPSLYSIAPPAEEPIPNGAGIPRSSPCSVPAVLGGKSSSIWSWISD